MNRHRKNLCRAGVIFIALGLGIIAVCVLPGEWMLVFIAAALVAAGLMLLKR